MYRASRHLYPRQSRCSTASFLWIYFHLVHTIKVDCTGGSNHGLRTRYGPDLLRNVFCNGPGFNFPHTFFPGEYRQSFREVLSVGASMNCEIQALAISAASSSVRLDEVCSLTAFNTKFDKNFLCNRQRTVQHFRHGNVCQAQEQDALGHPASLCQQESPTLGSSGIQDHRCRHLTISNLHPHSYH